MSNARQQAAGVVAALFRSGFLRHRSPLSHRQRADAEATVANLGAFVQEQPGTVYVDGFQDVRFCFESGDVWIERDADGRIVARVEPA